MSQIAMLYSVIIPTFNRAPKIARLLKSLQNQTFKDFEVLVCDDGSTDNTAEVVNKFRGDLSLFYLPGENWGGPARPRNRGLLKAKGEWVAFLDSDDWWYPEKLAKTSSYSSTADIIYHDLDMYSETGEPKGVMQGEKFDSPIFSQLLIRKGGVPNSSLVIKKQSLQIVGGVSEEKKMIGVEDFEMLLRLSLLTEKFVYLNESLGAYEISKDALTKDVERRVEQLLFFSQKYGPKLNVPDSSLEKASTHFKSARALHVAGKPEKAFPHYKITFFSTDWTYKIKAFIGMCLSLFPYLIGNFKRTTKTPDTNNAYRGI